MRNFRWPWFVLIALSVAALACNLPSNPQPPIASLVPSTQDAATFEEVFIQAVQAAGSTNQFNATVTQEQFSSWLDLRAPEYAKSQGQEWPFKNTQAAFKDGKVTLYAVLAQKGAPESPVQLVLIPVIDPNGEFTLKVDSGQYGIIGLPDALLKRVTEIVQDAVKGQLDRIKGKYKLTTLTVGQGTVTVAGQLIR